MKYYFFLIFYTYFFFVLVDREERVVVGQWGWSLVEWFLLFVYIMLLLFWLLLSYDVYI